MTIASKLETINSALSDIKTAIVAKGVTPSGDITTYSTAIDNISGGGMDTVEVTNYTENAISTGDKVWINKEGTDYKLVDFYKKYYNNFNVVGSPSIDRDSGYASGFSSSNYLGLPKTFSPGDNAWEIVVCVNPVDISQSQHFFGVTNNNNSVLIELYNNSYSMYLSSNGSTWDIAARTTGQTIPASNYTKTWIKISYDTTKYILQTSTDGVNYNAGYSVTSSMSVAQNKNLYIGACWDKNNGQYFRGSFVLSECYIKIGNDIWWTPAENIISGNITGDTLTGIADDNFTASSTSLNVNYLGSYVGTVLTNYVGDQTQANSTVTIYKNKSFECLFKVKKMDGNDDTRMFDCRKTNLTTYPAFYIRNGSSRIWATANTSTSGTENYGYSYTIPDNGKWFYIKAYYDPSNLTVTYTWSYDKVTWTSIWSYTFSSSAWFNGNVSEAELIMYIGCRGSGSAWTGLTDLSECYFKVDDQIVWDGTTFTPGSTGDVEIGEIIEPTISRLEITPSTSSQTFDSNSVDGYKPVIVSGVTSSIDANIIPENIKKDITILGVIGTHEGGGSTINNQNKIVSAETSQKYVTFDSGYTGLGTVTINAVDSSIDSNIISGNIIEGKSILGVPGSAKAGANGYNFKVVGSSPSITQNGIASGFTGTDHLIQFEIPSENITSLEFVTKFTLPQSFSQLEDGKNTFAFTKGFGTVYVEKSGSTCTIRFGYYHYFTSASLTVYGGETYWFKSTWDGTSHVVYYSTDGSNWTMAGSGRSATENPYTTKFVFGNRGDGYDAPFLGSIDLSETYVKVNNGIYWTWKTMSYPMDIDLDGYYEVDPSYTGFSHINVHVLDAATEMLQEINSGSGSVALDESE